ncbi:hypothetical protein LTR96_010917 [Exophiala xenobiotica]|nr:hypothetical protein LTR92_010723 [Exophiala xenobiotica]KAK5203269.1 hypothetical protein LTR41_010993 [Exophiala xenobiotica]KAK5214816.1 hypothetical protein LTR72_012067 [Exophiala xenobiotica]KAK5217355.1 hypothetical protein LTR47_011880 [Exophiala xenobiotica]KAK5241978.1 hypothetical protein LTS06_011805 [Exophiala xenobiotica]
MDVDDGIGPSDHRKSPYDMHHDDYDRDGALRRLRTAGSISITPELFEKIYLSPANRVSNNLRSTLGNPTPLALCGFLLSLSPLSNVLLGWRKSGDSGAAEVGVYYFFGGLLMIIGSVLEFILGNTFPFVVFGSFGAFWLSWAATLTPFYNASIAYDPTHPAVSATNATFASTFAFFHLYMGVLCFIYLLCSLRTNICFVLIFLSLVPAFSLMAATYWQLAEGHGNTALTCQHAAGGLVFAVCLLGWYLLAAQLLASVDFPINLPVGDLSKVVKGATARATAKAEKADSNEG